MGARPRTRGNFKVIAATTTTGTVRPMHASAGTRPVIGIALTGFGMEDDIRKGREAGFHHHLVKPIDLNRLDLLIQESANSLPPRN